MMMTSFDNLLQSGWIVLIWVPVLFVIIFVRYLIFSKVYVWGMDRLRSSLNWGYRVLSDRSQEWQQVRMEIISSAMTSVIFAALGAALLWLWHQGRTRLYHDWDAYPYYWLLLGPLLFLFAQETYYYWLHRWMHRPKVYKLVHQRHHESIETSAWTAFSFHPLESVLQALFILVAVLIIPLQEYLFLGLLTFMTLSATINHAGLEIFPTWFLQKRPFRWFIGATHHDLHHRRFLCNYGLYFTFWDDWMGTESEEYTQRVDQISKGRGE